MIVAAPPHALPYIKSASAKVVEGAKVPEGVIVKLRGVNCDGFFSLPTEKETYKVLHQLEFCSFREQALLSAKLSAASQNHMYDDYYEMNEPNKTQNVFESNQKSMILFLVNSHSSIQRSEQLRVLDSEILPDLKAFQSLGFPLKQTVKVNLTSRQSQITKKQKPGDTATSQGGNQAVNQLSSSQSVSKLYGFQTLPLMETAVGS